MKKNKINIVLLFAGKDDKDDGIYVPGTDEPIELPQGPGSGK